MVGNDSFCPRPPNHHPSPTRDIPLSTRSNEDAYLRASDGLVTRPVAGYHYLPTG